MPNNLDTLQELTTLGATAGALDDLEQLLSERSPTHPGLLLTAMLLEAGGGSSDRIDDCLERAKTLPSAAFWLALRLARRRDRDASARDQSIVLLENLLRRGSNSAQQLGAAEEEPVSRSRVELLLASIYDDDDDSIDRAEEGYCRALLQRPKETLACNNLGVIALRRGRFEDAATWFAKALEADPRFDIGYLNVARLFYAAGTSDQITRLADHFGHVFVLENWAQLAFALISVAREDAQQAMATRGHQLKNVLGVIGTRLRSIARKSNEQDIRTGLVVQCEQLTSLYDDWAQYLRSMREDVDVVETFAINELLTEAARSTEGKVQLRLADRLPELSGVRRQVLEAFVNLMRNGIEAQGPDETLYVESNALRRGRGVQIVVRDRGPGVAPIEVRRMFAPGYTTKPQGSGFGLSISDRIIRSHGGQLEVDVHGGTGTEIRVTMPAGVVAQLRGAPLSGRLARVLRNAVAAEYVVEE